MEQNITTCSVCQANKIRIKKGLSPNGKRRYYSDENGKAWRGKVCPSCSKKKHSDYIRGKREDKEIVAVIE